MRSCSRSLAGVCATVRFGFAGVLVGDGDAVSNRLPRLPQAESAKARHSKEVAAKRRRPVLCVGHPARSVTSATRNLRTRSRSDGSDRDLISFEHDLFEKPVPTFPDHALVLVLTRFLHANRCPLRSKTL